MKKWPAGIAEMLISTFFFALMNFCVKGLPGIPTHEMVFFRALGVFTLSGLSLWKLKISPWGQKKSWLLLRGLYGTLGLSLYFWTLKNMPLASAVTIQYLSPIFSTVVAIWLLKEVPPRRQWLFFGISILGVMLIKGFDTRIAWLPLVAGIGAAICSALAYNYVRKLRGLDHPLVTVFYFPLVTLSLVSPYTLTHWVRPHGQEWLWLGLIGIFTHFAQYYLTKALQAEKMAIISQLNYIGVAYALAMGWFFFHEQIPPLAILGLGLVIAGVVLGNTLGRKQENKSALMHTPSAQSKA
ncbi:EamA family transporter [bacterium (Candidatus Blackallbacteria) CG17_big_fil_post_rev_8_21_14_2_50_48_46]|uniref:EamA family transporter n=1 Tax=bacterium (Candidatus Blackallbacteria) CG17_big_fil_post_rev_8_21_14_2_50_48_46 TaxID=2014261 RepID=A0A2M7G4M6_9BACT|nr:MAG: EamA family transporter [bacterium (Candidatus Blackallbacteria) CG18_big_fil_WC_8_21_14_2_50_49_26]PIW16849.1 MAG: EamA family transporter [bacterium (Candidatus Blackallbacteria) CG17_big_fil_post_rev_8_21_14_2_50_48_46]PIW48046.1 MAG: EamA family transporter [bacterium (Candidatus Blackallbacteria) CG13_big_fil_rev_8_21_14_2_50_49_14]